MVRWIQGRKPDTPRERAKKMTVNITDHTETVNRQTQLITDWAKFRQSFSNEAPPRDTPRSWGFEIETPEADELYHGLSSEELELMDFCEDASIDGAGNDECECECRYCYYHECSCDSCEVEGSEDPEHGCGSEACYSEGTEYQEVKTLDGGVKTTHPEALTALVGAGLETVKITQQCGLHLNIGSADLTPLQVAKVLTAYRLGAWLFDTITGRPDNRYSQKLDPEQERLARLEEATGKYSTVNTQHHFNNVKRNPERARLEFRQHAGENSASEIRAWAWLLCELVEFAKTDRPVYWLAQAKTLAEFRKALI
jgi:hypothetical protein